MGVSKIDIVEEIIVSCTEIFVILLLLMQMRLEKLKMLVKNILTFL
jgi:hypothetical protein